MKRSTERARRWPRRLAVSILSGTLVSLVLFCGFACWVIQVTVPVVVVDGDGNPVSGVVIFRSLRIDMVDALGQPAGYISLLDFDPEQKPGVPGRRIAPRKRDWSGKARMRVHGITRRFGVALEWDKSQPVFSGGTGTARVPADTRSLTAISLGDLKTNPDDAYIVETTPGRRGSGPPARIVLRRADRTDYDSQKRVTWHFLEAPLGDIIRDAERSLGTTINVDLVALQEEGVSLNAPVTVDLTDVPVRSALRHVLDAYNLTFVPGAMSILITNQSAGGAFLEIRLYPVADLLTERDGTREEHATKLRDIIQQAVAPNTWSVAGGPAEALVFASESTLAVSHIAAFHEQVQWFLATLRNNGVEPETDYERQLRRAFAAHVTCNYRDVPLSDVFFELCETTGIGNFAFHKQALAEQGVTSDSPVTLNVQDVELRSALAQMLGPLNLTTIIEDGLLIVTSGTHDDKQMEVRIIPVAHLLGGSLNAEELCARIERGVEPSSWRNVGGTGWIQYFAPKQSLVIFQSKAVHSRIQALIDEIAQRQKVPITQRR